MSNTLSPLSAAIMQFVEVLVEDLAIAASSAVAGPSSSSLDGFGGSSATGYPTFNGSQDFNGLNVGGSSTSGQGSGDTVLAISSDTNPQTVKDFIGTNNTQPKIAVTQDGGTILVLATSTDASGQDLVETANPGDPEGGAGWMPLSDFDKDVAYLDQGTNGRGTEVTSLDAKYAPSMTAGVQPGAKYTFNAFYIDPKTQQTMVSLADANGQNINLTTNDFAKDFGGISLQNVMHNSLSGAAHSTMSLRNSGGAAGDGFSIAPSTSSGDVKQWLQQGQPPFLATDYTGKTYVVDQVGSDMQGDTAVVVQDPANPSSGSETLSLADFSQQFHYLDRGTGGAGTPFKALNSSGQLQAGKTYAYKGMSVDANGQAQVNLMGSDNLPTTLPLSQFANVFGQQGLQNLLVSSRTNPAAPGISSDTYGNVQNSELFAASSGSMNDLQQGGVGDCYLESSLAALERQNPNYLQNMIRPSTDGNPNDYDVRFYLPQKDGTSKPVWVTVNNQLPMTSSGTLAGSRSVLNTQDGLSQIGPALIEKAYVQFNQQYVTQSFDGGYRGINGGSPGVTMQYLTGQAHHDSLVADMSSDQIWQALSASNTGAPVVAGTQAGNTLEPGLTNNIVQSHAYTVLGTYTDPQTGEQMVKLRNPWGKNTDASGKPIEGTDGQFAIPLSEFEKYFVDVTQTGPDPRFS